MSKKELPIKFSLVKIEEKQFASFEEVLEEDQSVEQEVAYGFGVDIERQVVGVTMDFKITKGKIPLLKQSLCCYFKIDEKEFNSKLVKDNAVVLPCALGKHLAMITTSTTRGVLFANTKNTPFNQYVIGLINVDALFEEDIVMNL